MEGPLYKNSMKTILEQIQQVPTIITTWDNQPQEHIDLVKQYAITVILTSCPDPNKYGNIGLNYPNLTLTHGFIAAKQLGYTHVLRYRSDQYSPKIKDLFTTFVNESDTRLVGIGWFIHPHPVYAPEGYIMDHVMYGPIDLIAKYRSPFKDVQDGRFTEAFLQDSYFGKSPVLYNDVKGHFGFVLDKLLEQGVQLYFIERNTEQGDVLPIYKRNKCHGSTVQ